MPKSSDLEPSHKIPEKFTRYSMTFPGLLKMGLIALKTKYYLRTFLLPTDEVNYPSQD